MPTFLEKLKQQLGNFKLSRIRVIVFSSIILLSLGIFGLIPYFSDPSRKILNRNVIKIEAQTYQVKDFFLGNPQHMALYSKKDFNAWYSNLGDVDKETVKFDIFEFARELRKSLVAALEAKANLKESWYSKEIETQIENKILALTSQIGGFVLENEAKQVPFDDKYFEKASTAYKIRHILFSKDGLEKDSVKVKEITAEILKNTKDSDSFAKFAEKYSEDPATKNQGGLSDNEFSAISNYDEPELVSAVVNPENKVGDIIPNIKTSAGTHIIFIESVIKKSKRELEKNQTLVDNLKREQVLDEINKKQLELLTKYKDLISFQDPNAQAFLSGTSFKSQTAFNEMIRQRIAPILLSSKYPAETILYTIKNPINHKDLAIRKSFFTATFDKTMLEKLLKTNKEELELHLATQFESSIIRFLAYFHGKNDSMIQNFENKDKEMLKNLFLADFYLFSLVQKERKSGNKELQITPEEIKLYYENAINNIPRNQKVPPLKKVKGEIEKSLEQQKNSAFLKKTIDQLVEKHKSKVTLYDLPQKKKEENPQNMSSPQPPQ